MAALCALFAAAFCVSTADAALLTVSGMAPTVDHADIANLGGAELMGEDLNGATSDVYGDAPAQGQLFTTGSNADGYNLHAITLRCTNGAVHPEWGGFQWDYPGYGPYNVQVGTVNGTSLTPIATDSTTGTVDIYHTNYVTFNLTTPIHLNANTQYGFDWSSAYGGFRAANVANGASTGLAYSVGTVHDRDNNALVFSTGLDRVFHLDMLAGPAVPEPSTIALIGTGLIGLLAYAWRKRKCVPSQS